MSFPTTSILDDFTRANENPLSDGGNWAGPIFFPADDELQLVSDQCANPDPDASASSYWTTDFDGPTEVWVILDGTDNSPYVAACVSGESVEGGVNGYFLSAISDTEITLTMCQDSFGGDTATIADLTSGFTIGSGDGLGLNVDTGTLEVWYKPAAGSWTLLTSVSDATYASGKLGLGWSNGGIGTDFFTEFGGGGNAAPADFPLVSKRGLTLQVTDLMGTPIGSPAAPMPVRTPTQPQVTIPISDSRTGQFTLSMFERIAGSLPVAQAAVKVFYMNPKGDEQLLINGIILNKEDDFDAETTTVSLHDSTIRLKKRFLGYNHYSIMLGEGLEVSDGDVNSLTGGDFDSITSEYGIPLDGTGLRLLLLDTSHGAMDWRGWPISGAFSDVPAMGIRYSPDLSHDDANRQPIYGDNGIPPTGFAFTGTVTEGDDTITDVSFSGDQTIADVYEFGALSGPGIADFANVVSASGTSIVMSRNGTADETAAALFLEDAIYCQLSRGDCVYDDITDIVQAQGAFECDWLPIDADHLGKSGADWVAGQLAELYTSNRIGTDRSIDNTEGHIPVQFVHGLGGFHLTHSPDSDSLITYEVQVGPGGPDDPNDLNSKVTLESDSGIPTYGFWEDWQQATSAGTGDTPISNAVLENRAEAILTAYQAVPQFITATCDTDQIGTYCFGTDFFLGDTVTVYAKKGFVTVGPVDVRITQVEVTQVDENGNCQLDLTMVPYLTASADVGGGSDGG